MKKIILLAPLLLLAQNKLLTDTNGSIIDIGSNVAQKYIEIPLSKGYLSPKYEKDDNGIVYDFRLQSDETKCVTDDFNHENCPIDKFRYECNNKFDTTDGFSQKVDTILKSVTFCKAGEIKKDGICYLDTNKDGKIDDLDIKIYRYNYYEISIKPSDFTNSDYGTTINDGSDDKWGAFIEAKLNYKAKISFSWGADDYHFGAKIKNNDSLVWSRVMFLVLYSIMDNSEKITDTDDIENVYWESITGKTMDIDGEWVDTVNYTGIGTGDFKVKSSYMEGKAYDTVFRKENNIGNEIGDYFYAFLRDGGHSVYSSDYLTIKIYPQTDEDRAKKPFEWDKISGREPIYCIDGYTDNGNHLCYKDTYCPTDYKKIDNYSCQKSYTYYNYTCPNEPNVYGYNYEPLDNGGFLSINPKPPQENCVRLNTVCPIDATKICSKYEKDNPNSTIPQTYQGYSKKIVLPNYPNDEIYYEYKCDKNENGNAIYGYIPLNKGGIGSLNPTPPQGNCVYKFNTTTITQKEYKKIDKYINTGGFKEEMYGVVEDDILCKENSTNNQCQFQIDKITANDNQLCFYSKAGESECVTIDERCSMNGEIKTDKTISYMAVFRDNNNTIKGYDNNSNYIGEINSNCYIDGKVGQIGSSFGITSVKTDKSSIKFWDSYNRGFIGLIDFISNDLTPDGLKENQENGYKLNSKITFLNMKDKGFLDFYSYNNKSFAVYKDIITYDECNKLIENTTWRLFYPQDENERIFVENISLSLNNYNKKDNEKTSCVIVTSENDSYESIDYLEKTITTAVNNNNTGFYCSPLSCEEHSCQYNYCPDGYSTKLLLDRGIITQEEANNKCIGEFCDSNKEYENRCGVVGGCSENDGQHIINQADGVCYKVICPDNSIYNPQTNSCETMKCKGIEKEGKCYTVGY